MNATLKYHGEALRVLAKPPRFSQSAAKKLQRREEQLGILFPASVREFYSLGGAFQILKRTSHITIVLATPDEIVAPVASGKTKAGKK